MKEKLAKYWGPLLAVLAVVIVATALFAYGSVNDLSFAIDMYNPDSFWARFTAGFGPMSLYLTMIVAGCFVVLARKSFPLGWKIAFWIFGLVLIAGGGFLMAYKGTDYRSGYSLTFTILFSVIVTVITCGLIVWLFSHIGSKRLLVAAILMLAILLLELLLVEVIKPIWSRPRPYLIFELDTLDTFLPWYNPGAGKDIKSLLLELGLNEKVYDPADFNDYFKSFPSGHTSHGTLLAPTLTIMLSLDPRSRKFAPIGFLAGALFGFGVGIGRTMIGAHYLSDTIAGFSITMLSFALVIGAYFLIKKYLVPKFSKLKPKQGA